MKRDLDLARLILQHIEESNDPYGPDDDIEIEGYTSDQISYHTKLLAEAGLIEAEDISTFGPNGFTWRPISLTWEGHEFLEASRDDTRWNKTKRIVIEKSGGLAFEALKYSLIQGVKSVLT